MKKHQHIFTKRCCRSPSTTRQCVAWTQREYWMLFIWTPAKCLMHFPTVFTGKTVKLQIRCLAYEMGGKFIHDLDDGNKSTFSMFTDDTEVTGGVNI